MNLVILTSSWTPPPSFLEGRPYQILKQNKAYLIPDTPNTLKQEVIEAASKEKFDFAFVPQTRNWSDYKLLVTDMDSTLITVECIDEIADMRGLKTEVSAITAAAMRGELDFSESLKRRVALLKGLDEEALHAVYRERVKLTPGAETLIHVAKSFGVKILVVSGGFTFFTQKILTDYNLDFAAANTLEVVDGKLTGQLLGPIVDAQGKVDALYTHCRLLDITPKQVIGMGDGANDLKFLACCGVSFAFHAKPVVREAVTHPINYSDLDSIVYCFNKK